jgi:hypothetical protein
MKNRFRALLVYGFALTAMSYAIWQADLSVLPVASAEWTNGCCMGSNDCGNNMICWTKPSGWEDCFVGQWYDSECDCMLTRRIENYCNPPGQPPGGGSGKGPGGILD